MSDESTFRTFISSSGFANHLHTEGGDSLGLSAPTCRTLTTPRRHQSPATDRSKSKAAQEVLSYLWSTPDRLVTPSLAAPTVRVPLMRSRRLTKSGQLRPVWKRRTPESFRRHLAANSQCQSLASTFCRYRPRAHSRAVQKVKVSTCADVPSRLWSLSLHE